MPKDLHTLSIHEASALLAAKKVTSLELTRACLAQIKERDGAIHAYLEVFEDAEAQAMAADARRAKGEEGDLLGVPLAIKDNILFAGHKASAASKMLEQYTASYDATVVARLRAAGAVILGRTNMDEFALGGSTENSAFGVTYNPHDETRVAGGTSGASAAAVAAGMALGALGTDTGGSVRNPASFCGVVGLKPTYGAVSRSGVIAAVSSFDQVGPLTKTVSDAELLFNTIRGQDALDGTSIPKDLYPALPLGTVIGVPRALLGAGIDADVLARFEESLTALVAAGYTVVDIELPSVSYALATYYITNFAEVSSNLARFDGIRYGLSRKGESLVDDYATTRGEGFGPEARRRIMLGTYVLSAGYYDAYYGKATAARAQLTKEFSEVLSRVSVIATPTMPTPAFAIGEKSDPLAMYLADIFTVMANLTGHPALSVPSGTVPREGKELPVGMQFTAAHGNEAQLFAVGKALTKEGY